MARAWHLVRRPRGLPEPDCFALRDIAEPTLDEGEIRVANRLLSVDPYMRGQMQDRESYIPPYALDRPMTGGAIGEVVESRSDQLPVGALVSHMAGWRDIATISAREAQALPADSGLADGVWLGVLGLTGITAWFGLLDVAAAKPDDIVFVSGAAGAVGSVVVQLARARGMRVIGSAGGPEKCEWVRTLGAQTAIDYREVGDGFGKALRAAAPDGIDVCFDNVGGAQLDAAISIARRGARFALCGAIAGYNDGAPLVLHDSMRLIQMSVRMAGFLMPDFADRLDEFHEGMMPLVRDGTIASRETVTEGLEEMPHAFLGLFRGDNIGKALVRLAPQAG